MPGVEDTKEIRLDQVLFSRLKIAAYKNELVGILSRDIQVSLPISDALQEIKQKLNALGCSHKYLHHFINNNS